MLWKMGLKHGCESFQIWFFFFFKRNVKFLLVWIEVYIYVMTKDNDRSVLLSDIHYLYQVSENTTEDVETFSLPTDAHNVKKHRVIKTF